MCMFYGYCMLISFSDKKYKAPLFFPCWSFLTFFSVWLALPLSACTYIYMYYKNAFSELEKKLPPYIPYTEQSNNTKFVILKNRETFIGYYKSTHTHMNKNKSFSELNLLKSIKEFTPFMKLLSLARVCVKSVVYSFFLERIPLVALKIQQCSPQCLTFSFSLSTLPSPLLPRFSRESKLLLVRIYLLLKLVHGCIMNKN